MCKAFFLSPLSLFFHLLLFTIVKSYLFLFFIYIRISCRTTPKNNTFHWPSHCHPCELTHFHRYTLTNRERASCPKQINILPILYICIYIYMNILPHWGTSEQILPHWRTGLIATGVTNILSNFQATSFLNLVNLMLLI